MYSLVAQNGPVNPDGHVQENEHVFLFVQHCPLFKHGLDTHGSLS
jgi:hypothetical protein